MDNMSQPLTSVEIFLCAILVVLVILIYVLIYFDYKKRVNERTIKIKKVEKNKKKTTLQEFLDYVESRNTKQGDVATGIRIIDLKKKINELLSKEEEQIEDAFNEGVIEGIKNEVAKSKSRGLSDSNLQDKWRKVVLLKFGNCCFFCGKPKGQVEIECHHLVKRKTLLLRHDWRNGIPVCKFGCHSYAETPTRC